MQTASYRDMSRSDVPGIVSVGICEKCFPAYPLTRYQHFPMLAEREFITGRMAMLANLLMPFRTRKKPRIEGLESCPWANVQAARGRVRRAYDANSS